MRTLARMCALLSALALLPWAPALGRAPKGPERSWLTELPQEPAPTGAPLPLPQGLWEFTPGGGLGALGGATVAICPGVVPGSASQGERLLVVVVDAPSPMLRAGTVAGWLQPLARGGRWEGCLYTRRLGGELRRPRRFVFTLADGGEALTLTDAQGRLKVRPWLLLPFVARRTFQYRDGLLEGPDGGGLDGLRRLTPLRGNIPPRQPRVL